MEVEKSGTLWEKLPNIFYAILFLDKSQTKCGNWDDVLKNYHGFCYEISATCSVCSLFLVNKNQEITSSHVFADIGFRILGNQTMGGGIN